MDLMLSELNLHSPSCPMTIPTNHFVVSMYVAYVHNVRGFQAPTKDFRVRKAVQGVARLRPTYDTRLLMTEGLPSNLYINVTHLMYSPYDVALVRAVMLPAVLLWISPLPGTHRLTSTSCL